MSTVKQVAISVEDFFTKYRPLKNHLNPNSSWDDCMYETYGAELDHVWQVNETSPDKVWTILDCDGRLIAVNGYHHVNRMGYLLTENPAPADTFIEVFDEDDPTDDDLDVADD